MKCNGNIKPRGGNNYSKFTSEMGRYLELLIDKKPFITLFQRKSKILKKFIVNFYYSTIALRLKTPLYTTKIAKPVNESRNTSKTKEIRKAYMEHYD